MAALQGWRPAAIFDPFGHPTPYAYDGLPANVFLMGFRFQESTLQNRFLCCLFLDFLFIRIASSVLFIVSLVFLLHNSIRTKSPVLLLVMGVWQGVGMDSLKFHSGLPCPTLLRPAGRQPLKRIYSHFRGGLPTGWAACSHLLPIWTPAALYLCFQSFFQSTALPSRRVFDWVLRGPQPL
jgi:hypothetical protein